MKEYIVYGAIPSREREIAEYVKSVGGVILFQTKSKINLEDGMKYRPVQDILQYPNAEIIISSGCTDAIVNCLRQLGVKNRCVSYPHQGFYFYCNSWYDKHLEPQWIRYMNTWTDEHISDLCGLYEIYDERTRRMLTESISQRKLERFTFVEPLLGMPSIEEYFYDPDLAPTGEITLVDGGAYIGDSIQAVYNNFGQRMRKVYAFEPDCSNYNELCRCLSNIKENFPIFKYEALACGMYDFEGELSFSDGFDMASRIETEGNTKVAVKRIDDVVTEVIGDLCIKMDIEGSELKALQGAERTIKKYKPYMAICVYHKMEDIFEIPNYIRTLDAEYKFYLRAGTHMECYAVPTRRFLQV